MTDVADQYGFCMAAGDKLVDCNNYTAGGDNTGGGKSGNCKECGGSDHCCRKEERVLQEERTLKQEERMTSGWLREQELAKKEARVMCLHDKMQGKEELGPTVAAACSATSALPAGQPQARSACAMVRHDVISSETGEFTTGRISGAAGRAESKTGMYNADMFSSGTVLAERKTSIVNVAPALEQDRSEGAGTALEQERSEGAGTALEQERSQGAGTALEQERSEGAGTALEQEHTEGAAGAVLEQERSELAGAALVHEHDERAGTALEEYPECAGGTALDQESSAGWASKTGSLYIKAVRESGEARARRVSMEVMQNGLGAKHIKLESVGQDASEVPRQGGDVGNVRDKEGAAQADSTWMAQTAACERGSSTSWTSSTESRGVIYNTGEVQHGGSVSWSSTSTQIEVLASTAWSTPSVSTSAVASSTTSPSTGMPSQDMECSALQPYYIGLGSGMECAAIRQLSGDYIEIGTDYNCAGGWIKIGTNYIINVGCISIILGKGTRLVKWQLGHCDAIKEFGGRFSGITIGSVAGWTAGMELREECQDTVLYASGVAPCSKYIQYNQCGRLTRVSRDCSKVTQSSEFKLGARCV